MPFLPNRDQELLSVLAFHNHLDANQVLKMSATFRHPFPDKRSVNKRLNVLVRDGLLHRFHFHPQNRASPYYYTLTANTYCDLLPHASLPKRSFFRELSRSRQAHTALVNDIFVHLRILAHRDGVGFAPIAREDEVAYVLPSGERLYTDGDIDLLASDRAYRFHLEADNATEPFDSRSNPASLVNMVQHYEMLADQCWPSRFRVLFVTSGTPNRVKSFLDLAAKHAAQPSRWIFYAITLDGLLALPSLFAEHVLNHKHQTVPLVDKAPISPLPVEKPRTLTHAV